MVSKAWVIPVRIGVGMDEQWLQRSGLLLIKCCERLDMMDASKIRSDHSLVRFSRMLVRDMEKVVIGSHWHKSMLYLATYNHVGKTGFIRDTTEQVIRVFDEEVKNLALLGSLGRGYGTTRYAKRFLINLNQYLLAHYNKPERCDVVPIH